MAVLLFLFCIFISPTTLVMETAMPAMEAQKSVLVCMGGRNRIVNLQCSAGVSDRRLLMASVKDVFSDVLLKDQLFFLQIKDEEWGGAFVELQEDRMVPDKSVIEAVPVRVQSHTEVCYYSFLVAIASYVVQCGNACVEA